jgi:hypothetical protein
LALRKESLLTQTTVQKQREQQQQHNSGNNSNSENSENGNSENETNGIAIISNSKHELTSRGHRSLRLNPPRQILSLRCTPLLARQVRLWVHPR